jgi:phage terminase large subunit
MKLSLDVTPVFEKNYATTSRIVVNQGGSRSSKTYSICQMFITWAIGNSGKTYTIARKTLPSLRISVMRDFFEILNKANLYDQSNHNKTENTYLLNGNMFEFISMDQPQKKRGAKRDVLWLNEANEFTFEDWVQLNMRTTGRAFLDYNPSDEYHWIYDRIIPRDDCTFIKSTYKDNTFLEDEVIKEIEALKDIDENYWRVYGLGEVGTNKAQVFTRWEDIDQVPDGLKLAGRGMDFGYSNDPTTIVDVWEYQDGYILDEQLCRKGMTNDEIAKWIKENLNRREKIIADSAEPKSIEEIYRFGINIHPAWKGKDSIRIGIDKLKRKKMWVTKRSANLLKELRNYKYKQDKEGKILQDPVDMYNHCIDASRYALSHNKGSGNYGVAVV